MDVTLKESRKFAPSDEFVSKASVDRGVYERWAREGKVEPEVYWSDAALELTWFKPWETVRRGGFPTETSNAAQWFIEGELNASYNCLDRHLATQAQKTAIVWEGEPGEVATWTYSELHATVERLAAGLRRLGLKKGDRVAIYMPLVPEAIAAMHACARVGATHTVVFGGFSAESLKDRINDAQATMVLTGDGGYRKGGWVSLKEQVDRALEHTPSIKTVVTLKREKAGSLLNSLKPVAQPEGTRVKGRAEYDWHELIASVTDAERASHGGPEHVPSEHPLFILYTSGTTGKPKGLVHSTGGYLTGALRTTRMVFDIKASDLYWCTADIGWVTGHSYVAYGPLAAGASIFLYEGAPTYPKADRFWAMIDRHKISVLYTAPTAIRAFMRLGEEPVRAHNLSSLRLLGSVGEPINPEAWIWYRDVVGDGRCPIVDTFWQTETGAIVVSPVPGVTVTKPGSATRPLPGYDVEVVDKKGEPVPPGSGGYLVIRKPWPSMARTIHGDAERFRKTYFTEFPGMYFTGDGAHKDEEGYIWCLGRVDDVLNVSGHRLGTMEIESALVSHPGVAEAAVVGRPDDLKGQAIVAFVTLKAEAARKAQSGSLEGLKTELRSHVGKEIGALAKPDDVRFAEALPKTRSGKIMRRLLRELATSGRVQGDTTTLEDLGAVAALSTTDEDSA